MCGFAGFYQKQNQFDTQKLAQQARRVLRSRGTHTSQNILELSAFVYARLPTDDISNKTHGIISQKNASDFFLYNGILNNIEELVAMFDLDKNIKSSDTTVLKIGFKLYGKKFLRKCRGMFAFANVSEDEVVLVRDTIGIKPLYYIYEKNVFAFASEIKALMPLSPKRIHEVTPGQVIRYSIKSHNVIKEQFIYDSNSKDHSYQRLKKCLLESLVRPTQRYLAQGNNLKIGLMLSGGLDSSILLTLLYQHLSIKNFKQITAFCVSLNDAEDHLFAQRIADQFQIKLIVVSPDSAKTSARKLGSIVRQTESPYARVAKVALLQDVIAIRMQQLGIHVAISGEGADEIFYGYRRFIEGKTPIEIQKIYDKFFEKIFYRSLLQRLDRVFARRQIETRVPFLDQTIVALAQNIPADKKIAYDHNRLITKKFLRDFAKIIAVPTYIIKREKITMTQGATKYANVEDADGYLELYFRKKHHNSVSLSIQKAYMSYYSHNDCDVLTGKKNFLLRDYELKLNEAKNYVKN